MCPDLSMDRSAEPSTDDSRRVGGGRKDRRDLGVHRPVRVGEARDVDRQNRVVAVGVGRCAGELDRVDDVVPVLTVRAFGVRVTRKVGAPPSAKLADPNPKMRSADTKKLKSFGVSSIGRGARR